MDAERAVGMTEMTGFEVAPAERLASRWWRPLLIALGTLSVVIGAIGMFVPLLPTTVFLLIGAACFGKSSPGAYRWLMGNRIFGRTLRNYHEHRGATRRTKVTSVVTLWVGIAVAGWLVGNPWVDVALAVVAAAVTIHLLRLRTIAD